MSRIKKLAAATLVVVIAACLGARFLPRGWLGFPTYASVDTICPGDVNHDDQRDIRDVIAIQAHILGKKTLSVDLQVVADVNQDSKVDILDIARLIQHITGRKPLVECKGTLLVTPASLDFGDVRVATGKDLPITVSNGGNARLTITAIAADNPQFGVVSPAAPFEVGPGAERSVTVRFSPASVASHSGTLTVSGNSGGAAMTAVVTLSGAGLTAANPSPTLTKLTPSSVTAGSGAFTLSLEGTNFIPASQVYWDGSARPTVFVSSTQLQASIGAVDVATDDAVIVRVMNPAPGGGVSGNAIFLVNRPQTTLPAGFWIRYIAPKKGPAGTPFTLLGKGFSPVTADNAVTFFKSGTTPGVNATLTGSTDTTITGTVPAGLSAGTYAVYVTVAGKTTQTISFAVTTTAASLDLRPSMAFLLMPPGSGKEYLVIGGGTPPYKLKPLAAEQQATAKVELKGNTVEVTGLSAGQYGSADITVQVEDSAASPATDTATVRVQTPKYAPDFDVVPHTLLAGSFPAFTIRVDSQYSDMRTARTRIKIEKARTDFSKVVADGYVGFGDEDESDFNAARTTGIQGASKVTFDLVREYEDGQETIAKGTCEPGLITILDQPVPASESVFPTGTTTHFTLFSGMYGVPAAAEETFNITAVFTSVSVHETNNLPMTVVRTRTFKTVAVPASGPAIHNMLPDRGEIGREVWLRGSGFSSTAGENQVTFAGPNQTRVPAIVKGARSDRLAVYVPDDAQTGPVRVTVNGKTSNSHEFWARFHPDADCYLRPNPPPSGPKCLTLSLLQPNGEVGVGSLTAVLDMGSINTVPLAVGVSAGQALLSDPYDTGVYEMVYGGQEATGAHRHFFEIKSSTSSSTIEFVIYVFPNAGGQGVTLEAPLSSKWSNGALLGKTLFLSFDKPWYVGPAAGTVINATIKIGSARWLFFPGSEMQVQMTRKIQTQ